MSWALQATAPDPNGIAERPRVTSKGAPIFRPPGWPTLATIVLGGVFVAAGLWQLSRAAEKRELLAAFDAGSAAKPMPAPASVADVARLRYRMIRVAGRFDAGHQVLLDARTRDGRAGYEVLTPLTGAAIAVLINRGWVPANPDRSRLPDIAIDGEPRTVTGLLDRLPRAALRSELVATDASAPWPRRMLYPTTAEIGAALGYPVADYQLLLGPGEPGGFTRDWRPILMTPAQHVGYAVQWFALATALVVIYAVLNLRKKAAAPNDP